MAMNATFIEIDGRWINPDYIVWFTEEMTHPLDYKEEPKPLVRCHLIDGTTIEMDRSMQEFVLALNLGIDASR
jgi:hypothetical protein